MKDYEEINAIQPLVENMTWTPIVREETHGLLARVFGNNESAKEKVIEETLQIMGLCGDPFKATNNETGLVFGYVQSGKTLSFTTLTALARDNNYQLIIIIAGTSTNLVNQSFNRLEKDLNIHSGFYRRWLMLKNPQDPNKNPQDKASIKRNLEFWSDPRTPTDQKKTVLVTVMKNPNHLQNLLLVLEQLDLNGVPTLIIDDEGDQASMNTKASSNSKKGIDLEALSDSDMSTIYKRIHQIKATLPHHTFLQYTATPQAPLFINKMDILSPNFIQLLKPGEKYTGGKSFFHENPLLVRSIPYSEIYSEDNYLQEVPDTLLDALRIFFLGVTSGYLIGEKDGNPRNRSMMVHPSRLVDEHVTYSYWVNLIKNQWAKIFIERDNNDETKKEIINDFRKAYDDLKRTVSDILPFEQLIHHIGYQIKNTAVEELNSRSGSLVDWNSNYAFILIGGQAMDRGFTVEGLTVTYMPRSSGVGNADTLQQRARFFGYKKDYLGYCRVYLDLENITLFSEYVDHEEDVRSRLNKHKLTGKHLDELRREFVLNQMFQITRKNVLSNETEKKRFGNTWLRIRAPHDTEFSIEHNVKVFNEFKSKYWNLFNEDPGHENRTKEQRHLLAKLSLKDLYIDLISKLKFTRLSDSSDFTSLKGVIEAFSDYLPPEDGFVYLISKGEARTRALNNKNEIVNLFQGKNPKSGQVIYPGDTEIKEVDHISIQIHNLNFRNTSLNNIISVAVWIPERLSLSLIKFKEQR